MGIGTSKGAFYQDEASYWSSRWDNRYDDNVLPPAEGSVGIELTPTEMGVNKGLEKSEMDNIGIEVNSKMPFPDNKNPDSDFNSRFGNLPPSGVLNDLKKPAGETRPLVRRIKNELVPPNKMGITDEDIDTAIDVGLGAAGGGLHTIIKAGEKVGRAALKYGDEIFVGTNHGEAFTRLEKKFKDFDFKNVADGFVTTQGRFVSRAEALEIAENAKQVYKKQDKIPGLELTSEDLLRGY